MTLSEARHVAKKKLSAKRYRHTKNVAAMARELALHWGVDANKAELAGWLHDVLKESTQDELLQMLNQDGIMAKSTVGRPLPVWHGPAAAVYARHTLGVQDDEVLLAIAGHTTGRRGMTMLDKVLFLADATSAERRFEGVEAIRKQAKKNLNAAVLAVMENNVTYLNRIGKPLDTDTVAAMDAIKKEMQNETSQEAGD